ncbi:hypothetical protein BH11PSE5_BH11PSE5_24580 [soil metagenome]
MAFCRASAEIGSKSIQGYRPGKGKPSKRGRRQFQTGICVPCSMREGLLPASRPLGLRLTKPGTLP